MKMTMKHLALELSEDFDMTKKDAEKHLVAIFEVIAENMAAGHEINIPGFGKLRVKERKARQARNPKTGEMVEVAAKKVPNFLPAKQLKEAVNETD